MKEHPSQGNHHGLTCRDVAERVSEYLDDRLTLPTKIHVGLHLDSCARCRTYVRQIACIGETARWLPKSAPRAVDRLNLRRHFAVHQARRLFPLSLPS